MAFVKVFRASLEIGLWKEVIDLLEESGIDALTSPEEADVSIVLSGARQNPAVLKGRKILIYNTKDWSEKEPIEAEKDKFELWRPVLEEYYDEFIDVSSMSNKGTAETIIKTIQEMKNDFENTD